VVAVGAVILLFQNLLDARPVAAGSSLLAYVLALPLLGKILFASFLIGVPVILVYAWRTGNRMEFEMMVAAMVLTTFNTVFWTLFEQAGSSLTLFADRNTDLSVFGLFSISAGQTQFFNALFIVTLAPLMTILWTKLAARGRAVDPGQVRRRPGGRGCGLPVPGLGHAVCRAGFQGFGVVAGRALPDPLGGRTVHLAGGDEHDHQALAGAHRRADDGRVVFVDCDGTICRRNRCAGGKRGDRGGEVTNLKLSLDTYTSVFNVIGWFAVGIGVILLLLSGVLRKLMHGVR
jgi:POT family proton-dependent oligopeptide transporter